METDTPIDLRKALDFFGESAIFAKQACTSVAEIEVLLTEVVRLRIIVEAAINSLHSLESNERNQNINNK